VVFGDAIDTGRRLGVRSGDRLLGFGVRCETVLPAGPIRGPRAERRVIRVLLPNKLYKKGVVAQGVIVKRWMNTQQDITFGNYHVTTRLQLPDGSTAERNDSLYARSDGDFHEGGMIPVRYDAKDHSHFVIDFPLIRERQEERQTQSQDATNARIEAQLARANQPGASPGEPGTQSIPGLGTFDSPEDLKAKLLEQGSQGNTSVIDLSGRSASAPSGSDPVDQLTKLADLKDRGVLTEAEFEAEKAKILGES
jgi:hypothetical protein